MTAPDRTDRIEKSRSRFAAPPPNSHRKLRAEQARKLADAEDAYDACKLKLDRLKVERDEIRARLRPVLPTGVTVIAGGIEIKVTPISTGQGFSLKGFLDAGNKLTREMRRFVSDGSFYDRWSVKRRKAAG